jgi:hypothetical protein
MLRKMGQICDMLTRNKYDENKSPSLRCTDVKVILKMSEKYKKKDSGEGSYTPPTKLIQHVSKTIQGLEVKHSKLTCLNRFCK